MQFSQRQTGLTESLELVVDLFDWFDCSPGPPDVTRVGDLLLVNRIDAVMKLV